VDQFHRDDLLTKYSHRRAELIQQIRAIFPRCARQTSSRLLDKLSPPKFFEDLSDKKSSAP